MRDAPSEQNVATILRATMPDFPIPLTRTFPCGGMLRIRSTTCLNAWFVLVSAPRSDPDDRPSPTSSSLPEVDAASLAGE